jgi:ribosomal protein S12
MIKLLCRKMKVEAAASKSKKASKRSKVGAATTSISTLAEAPVSPGVITRRMTSYTSTPTSPGPTTRRMAAQLDISPGGIARRLIIN